MAPRRRRKKTVRKRSVGLGVRENKHGADPVARASIPEDELVRFHLVVLHAVIFLHAVVFLRRVLLGGLGFLGFLGVIFFHRIAFHCIIFFHCVLARAVLFHRILAGGLSEGCHRG